MQSQDLSKSPISRKNMKVLFQMGYFVTFYKLQEPVWTAMSPTLSFSNQWAKESHFSIHYTLCQSFLKSGITIGGLCFSYR
jgi:hypothetical protein